MFDKTKEKINRVKDNSYSVGDTVDEIIDIAKEDTKKIYDKCETLYQTIRDIIRNAEERHNDE